MSNPVREVLEWNHEGVLGDLLAIETHLTELGREQVDDSWCIKKHLTSLKEHFLKEAIIHAESLGLPTKPYKDFKAKIEKLPPNPTITQIRELRTEWRYIIKDPTLTEECPVCRSDITPEIQKLYRKITFQSSNPSNPSNEAKNLNAQTTHVSNRKIGERKMARLEWRNIATVSLVGAVAGTAGLALHYMGLAPWAAAQPAWLPGIISNIALVDIVAGIVLTAAGIYMGGMWLPILSGAGVALLGTGVYSAVTVAPAPAAAVRMGAPTRLAAVQPTVAPTAMPYIPAPGTIVDRHGSVMEVPPGTFG